MPIGNQFFYEEVILGLENAIKILALPLNKYVYRVFPGLDHNIKLKHQIASGANCNWLNKKTLNMHGTMVRSTQLEKDFQVWSRFFYTNCAVVDIHLR